ncbi:AraC family transcriptional regulator [Luteimonas huabeiensis]|uniref:AraC family transcriptional regulator n=1 Tax=Luteimonas huabeiensis TaxID=1244513 RepID=UPI0013625A25|nr:AraC family transcriptional regulator [Luteimonas huabeiensis]
MRAVPPVVSRGAAPRPGRRAPPVAPVKRSRVLRPGLSLLLGQAVEDEDMAGSSVDADRVRIVLVLGGRVDMAYDARPVRLGAGEGGADASIVPMEAPVECRRVVRRGDYSRRISIGLSGQWIAQSLEADPQIGTAGPPRRHLDIRCWRASAHARSIAEQLFQPPPLAPDMLGLYLESRAIELAFEALSRHDASERTPCRSLTPAAYRRMCEVRAFLQQDPAAVSGLDAIARHAGLGTATLQRHFRLAHGMTVSECIQRARLERAREALERDGADVRRAAVIAGYASPANFATAFRRRYGLPPSKVRPRI